MRRGVSRPNRLHYCFDYYSEGRERAHDPEGRVIIAHFAEARLVVVSTYVIILIIMWDECFVVVVVVVVVVVNESNR